MEKLMYSQFESELRVWPDDIDINSHVHNSKYFDYVLAPRCDQMKQCCDVSVDEFIQMGYGCVVKLAQVALN